LAAVAFNTDSYQASRLSFMFATIWLTGIPPTMALCHSSLFKLGLLARDDFRREFGSFRVI
jgi:hypothetical protein